MTPRPTSRAEASVLVERDEDVLASLALHRFLTLSQIRRLHFPGLTGTVARRSLARLKDWGLAAKARAPAPGHRSVWYATARGRATAGVPRSADPTLAIGSSKLAHTLATNEFCVALAEQAAARGDRFSARHWANEVAHRIPRSGVLIPDAVLAYEIGDGRQAFRFLEMDLGTMPVATVQTKFLRYAQYLASGPWHQEYLVFPKLAVVLSGRAQRDRLRRLLRLAALVRGNANELEIQLAAGDDVASEGPLSPVWHWAGGGEARGFLT